MPRSLRHIAASAALIATLASSALAATKEIWYTVTYARANPDGLFDRRVIGVNGTWPPPIIEINANDTLIAHVKNGLGDTITAVHHHGMFFNKTSWYDGAVGVTQCGIPPNATYDYVIDTKTAGQTGTYWYHGHSLGQYVDGLRAPLIIHNTPEAHKYDDEYVVALYDWYHEQHHVLLGGFLSEANPTGAEPVPKSAIIQIGHNGSYVEGFNENSTIAFKAGKTYRLRIINMSALAMFHVWLDGHNMTVIEVDGTDTEAYPIDQVTLSVAQRVSVLVTALNDTKSNFLFHANMNPDMFDAVPDDLVLNQTSTIVYNATFPMADETTTDEYAEFPDADLVPIIKEAEAAADTSYTLEAYFDTSDDGTNRAFFNLVTYEQPITPSLLTASTMGVQAQQSLAVYGQTNSYILQSGQNVELVIVNTDAGYHPFHLHGHKFQIVGTSMNVSSDDPMDNPPVNEGLANPMRRDTIMVPPGGSRTIRFRADNPGAWLFHCHIEWHLESGLAATFIEAPDQIQKLAAGQPKVLNDQCSALGISTTGNAGGKNSTTDFGAYSFGPYVQELGFHPKGIVALAFCVVSAIMGIIAVAWYPLGGGLDEDELELEVAAAMALKAQKGSKWDRAKKLFSKGPAEEKK
ncbi:multicopper oxidase [Gonapodya prolifera JEL478]|uniref:Multicopper oxidase n=1 Tax=Gonapodya prolifera (strain JEL478) TaxID=1344416 RepID=A0A139A7F3_GONPJ|nr:multicopper oxidase [Gonapodya prolifera JEL478]|eukprot:KXS12722.1 multicopper oxidase [Gonapodya prolifera JEL478]